MMHAYEWMVCLVREWGASEQRQKTGLESPKEKVLVVAQDEVSVSEVQNTHISGVNVKLKRNQSPAHPRAQQQVRMNS